jgi:hypothetical protein
VEHELNGYLTYDREVSKIDPEVMREVTMTLYDPPELKTIVPFGSEWELRQKGSAPRTINLPAGEPNDFMELGGKAKTPYRIKKTFVLDPMPPKVAVAIKGFTDSNIFINGNPFRKTRLSARFGEPFVNFYTFFGEEMELLMVGENEIAIETTGTRDLDLLDAAVFIYRD